MLNISFLAVLERSIPPGKLVLVVIDDDADVRRTLARLLRSCGHEVHAFASAEDYLQERCDADCAILDIQLPGMSGFTLEERIRREGSELPIVFITACADDPTRARVEGTHRHLLAKPFDDDGLLEAIDIAVATRS